MTDEGIAEPEDWCEIFGTLRDDQVEIDPFEPLLNDDEGRPANIDDEQVVAVKLQNVEAAEIRRGQRLLAKPHGAHRGPGGDPSLAEIRLMAIAIRAEWSGADLRRARCHQNDGVEVREVRMGVE